LSAWTSHATQIRLRDGRLIRMPFTDISFDEQDGPHFQGPDARLRADALKNSVLLRMPADLTNRSENCWPNRWS